jgi:hypothetical protein
VNLTTKRILKCLKTAGRYGDGDGLYLQVNTPGRGSWLLRYERNGRERAMGLASFPTQSSRGTGQGGAATAGRWSRSDRPQKKTQRQQQALEAARNITCQKCAELFFDAHADEWASPRHRQQWINSLRDYVFPIIGGAASKYRIGTNPARWGGNLEHLLAAPEKIRSIRHHPAMPCAEIGGFITELRKVEGTP